MLDLLKLKVHTQIAVSTIVIVVSAFISGLTPTRSIEYTLTGNVVLVAPAIKKLMITSSKDIIKDNAAPDIIPGISSGIVTCKNACHCVAPKSLAASSRFNGILLNRANTTIVTKGTQNDKCDKSSVIKPNFILMAEKICINAMPIIISGVKTGRWTTGKRSFVNLLLNLCIANPHSVPIITDNIVTVTERINEIPKEFIILSLFKSLTYHSKEKPDQVVVDFPELKEYTHTTNKGKYKNANVKNKYRFLMV